MDHIFNNKNPYQICKTRKPSSYSSKLNQTVAERQQFPAVHLAEESKSKYKNNHQFIIRLFKCFFHFYFIFLQEITQVRFATTTRRLPFHHLKENGTTNCFVDSKEMESQTSKITSKEQLKKPFLTFTSKQVVDAMHSKQYNSINRHC